MLALKIAYHARSDEYVFRDREQATKTLRDLESRIGKRWYGKNGDEENPTFAFKSGGGAESVVCLEKIESVTLIDLDEDSTLLDDLDRRAIERDIKRRLALKTARETAGLLAAAE